MNYYHKSIIENTGCTPEQVEEIEDIMRNDILHSTLDWLTKKEFKKTAKEAYEVYKFKYSPEGQEYMRKLKEEIYSK